MSTPPRFKLRPPGAPGNLPLLLGLLALIAIVTAVGAWNQSRQPQVDLTHWSQDPAQASATPASPAGLPQEPGNRA